MTNECPAQSRNRWVSLDIAKALSIFCVILAHTLVWWYSAEDQYVVEPSLFFSQKVVPLIQSIGLFPLMIPMAAGASLRFYAGKFWDPKTFCFSQKQKCFFVLSLAQKAFLIAFLGYAMNFLTWGIDSMFAWDVLQFIGFSLLVAGIIFSWTRAEGVLIAGGLVLSSASFLRDWIGPDNPAYWKFILIGDWGGDHFWPFFPWFSIFAAGFYTAHLYLTVKHGTFKKICLLTGIAFMTAAAMTGLFFLKIDFTNWWGPALFHPPAVHVLSRIGAFMTLVGILAFFPFNKPLSPYGFINTFSRGILFIYLIHTIVGYHACRMLQHTGHAGFLIMIIFLEAALAYGIGASVVYFRHKNVVGADPCVRPIRQG